RVPRRLWRGPLPGANGHAEPVLARGERAAPARVVAARRLIREVEVEDQRAVARAEVCALRGVEQIAAGAVCLDAAGEVAEADQDPAGVPGEPVHGKAEGPAGEQKPGVAHPGRAV